MDASTNSYTDNSSQSASIGSAVRDILRKSRKRRILIRKRTGEKIFECSVLLAFILSVGAPVVPALVILGVWVESISVSFTKR